jgi:hypothetical protein
VREIRVDPPGVTSCVTEAVEAEEAVAEPDPVAPTVPELPDEAAAGAEPLDAPAEMLLPAETNTADSNVAEAEAAETSGPEEPELAEAVNMAELEPAPETADVAPRGSRTAADR